MKKFIIASLLPLTILQANAQSNHLPSSGKVGIGTDNPTTTLHLDGFRGQPGKSGNVQSGIFRMNAGDQGVDWGETIDFGFHINEPASNPSPPSYGWLQSTNKSNLSINYNLALNPNGGNVGIGTDNPQAKLAVNGDIFSKKVKVTQSGWPDYVFEKSYRLPSLKDVAAYIQVNKHLPDVPSVEEIEEHGLNLGDNQAVLLKKIEELTLYVIELKKENEVLSKRIDDHLYGNNNKKSKSKQ